MKRIFGAALLAILAGCGHFNSARLPTPDAEPSLLKVERFLGQTIYIATVSLDEYEVGLVQGAPLASTVDLAKQVGADLAVNGGFFNKEGTSSNTLKVNKRWIQEPVKNRAVMGWSGKQFYFDRLRVHNKQIRSAFSPDQAWWEQADNIVNGTPLLIFEGQVLKPTQEQVLQSFLDNRYARTAVCLDSEDKLLFMVAEGGDRLSKALGIEKGLSISELTQYLKAKGCEFAINLDGGRSSTFVVAGKMVNEQPLLTKPRPVSNILYIKKIDQ